MFVCKIRKQQSGRKRSFAEPTSRADSYLVTEAATAHPQAVLFKIKLVY